MEKLILFDGAMGSELQKFKFSGCPEYLNISEADVISSIHKKYSDAGADILITNSFGANRLKLSYYNLEDKLAEIIEASVNNARSAAKQKKIAFDVGPTGKLLKPYGEASFDEIYNVYKEVAVEVQKSNPDYIILETFSQFSELRAAFLAFKENTDIPIMALMTFEESGKTLTGTIPEAFAYTMQQMGAYAVGVNCSVGPDKLKDVISKIAGYVDIPVIAMPNAGIPKIEQGKTIYDMKAEEFAEGMKALVENGADILGGCCGTTPGYIELLHKTLDEYGTIKENRNIKKLKTSSTVVCSSNTIVVLDGDIKVIGERINPTGRKIMRESLKHGDLSLIFKEAVEQETAGADILDVNVSVPGLDEVSNMVSVIEELQSLVKIPLQIDSTNPEGIEAALRVYNGVAIVNSVNAKIESLESILPKVKKYGAAVVGLTMETDIPKTADERVNLAYKIVKKAEEYGIGKSRIIIDPLTLTASAMQEYVFDTLKALTELRNNNLKTVLGISNVSYGLPERKLLNSTFLAMACSNGLSMAIINPFDKIMLDTILASRVLLNIDRKCESYLVKVSSMEPALKTNSTDKNYDWDIIHCIEKGLKDEAVMQLNILMKEKKPFEIIDDYIIPALKNVGNMYEKKDIYLPQLLQSADVVQILFNELRNLVDVRVGKGKIALATVKGDIHDIGKNIVKVMLQNNGYEVIDLGSDVKPEDVVECVKNNKIKLVGLSALMTTTVVSMEETINAIRVNNLDCRVMVGGAVLTNDLAKEIGADFYSKDAVEAVKVADKFFESIR